MNSSLEEERLVNRSLTNTSLTVTAPARDCPYCKMQMNSSQFPALNSHVRAMHPDRYIEFRTTKWPETTVVCDRCKFGSEQPIPAWQQNHTMKKCNENIACYKKYDTKNISFEEPIRGDEIECPQCNQKHNGIKGLVTHFRIAHHNEYIPWRTTVSAVLPFQCPNCKFCYSTQSELDTHLKKDGCKKNLELQKVRFIIIIIIIIIIFIIMSIIVIIIIIIIIIIFIIITIIIIIIIIIIINIIIIIIIIIIHYTF